METIDITCLSEGLITEADAEDIQRIYRENDLLLPVFTPIKLVGIGLRSRIYVAHERRFNSQRTVLVGFTSLGIAHTLSGSIGFADPPLVADGWRESVVAVRLMAHLAEEGDRLGLKHVESIYDAVRLPKPIDAQNASIVAH